MREFASAKMFSRILSLLTLALVIIPTSARDVAPMQTPTATLTCDSIEILSLRDFAALRNCTRVLGYVRLVNLQLSDRLAADISTNVVEINGYLLVHRVHGLSTLAHIFPRLTLVRGRQLLFDRYALVVYENRNLLNLGLESLLRIQAGHIRVESNPALCYVKTVNWVQLLGNSTEQHFWLKNNKPQSECPLCGFSNEINEDLEDPEVHVQHCWNYSVLQQRPGGAVSSGKLCAPPCSLRGCDENGRCCVSHCLSGCFASNCAMCANLRQELRCVDACSAGFNEYQQRECITTATCLQLGLIPHAGACLERCPSNHVLSRNGFGQPSCNLTCAGAYVIHSAQHLVSLRGCSTIQGSLTVALEDIHSKITDLENALHNITEITGFLKVILSPQLMSLQFLRKLNTIRGEELMDDKYALYVVDNNHLTDIWAPNQNVAILKGRIYFHLNPRLCYEKILALQSSLRSVEPITVAEASPNSNGERVICAKDSLIPSLNVTIEDLNSTAVRIKLDPLSADDKIPLLGYLHHYKEAPVQNVTLFDGRHGCGHDNWRMDITANRNVRHIISELKPYTQYAFFVKTLTMTDYHMQLDAYSPINYFRTLPSKPGPVAKLYYHSASTTQIVVHWWPPRLPNSIIEKYILFHEKVDAKHRNASLYNSKPQDSTDIADKPCECIVTNPEDSGALPDDENYYSKDQVIYDEALPDLIYVSRRIGRRRQGRSDRTSVDYDNRTLGASSSTTNAQHLNIDTSMHRRRQHRATDSADSDSPNVITEAQKKREEEAMRNFYIYRDQLELKALKEQDTGIANFPIIKPRPLCAQPNSSLDDQLQHNCVALEQYEGITVPGHHHSYTLVKLEPEVTYRITVRACAANVVNGCGVETSIYAETISKPISKFLKGLKPFD